MHLEGTLTANHVREMRQAAGEAFGNSTPVANHWRGLADFLTAYDDAASFLREAEQYEDLAYAYLTSVAADGCIYVELTVSPDHAEASGVAADDYLAAVARGIERARESEGIDSRIIVTAVREHGPRSALRLAQSVDDAAHPLVVGFGLAGDESVSPLPYAAAFAVAHNAGLGCTVHAGESMGPASVREALAAGADRIGHGTRSMEDPDLLSELARRNIPLECCLSSNVALGVVASVESHPLPAFIAAGIPVTLSSDDPGFFATSLANEYRLARTNLGLSTAELAEISATAISVAFADEDTKRRLLDRIQGDWL